MKKSTLAAVFLTWQFCSSLELKFELEDSRKDCFYEDVKVAGDNIDILFHVSEDVGAGARRIKTSLIVRDIAVPIIISLSRF